MDDRGSTSIFFSILFMIIGLGIRIAFGALRLVFCVIGGGFRLIHKAIVNHNAKQNFDPSKYER